jgi:hypothetical protein
MMMVVVLLQLVPVPEGSSEVELLHGSKRKRLKRRKPETVDFYPSCANY